MTESPAEWVGVVPWLLPVTAAFFFLALQVNRPIARATRVRPVVVVGLVVSVGLILGATLTPLANGAATEVLGGCDLSRMGPASLADLRRLNDVALNVLLFAPVGLAIGLVPNRLNLALLGAAIAFPFVIEGIQLAAPALGRGCQASDVIDNITGLLVGWTAGHLMILVTRQIHGQE